MGEGGGWARLVDNNVAVRFVDVNLRGAGQVIFQGNPITGAFFIAAIAWGGIRHGTPVLAVGAVVALLIATITAYLLRSDAASLRQGLFGFNGFLVGVAVPSFLGNTVSMWVLLVVGAAVSTVVMLAISNVMKTWGVPALTFPFVLTTWFVLLSAYSFGHTHISGVGPPALATEHATGEAALSAVGAFEAWLRGPAQVFLIDNWVSGVLVVLGVLFSSRWAAGFALLGSAIALGLSIAFGASDHSIEAGLFGFSPVLTAVGLGCVFYTPSWRVAAYAILGTVFTVLVQAALDAAMLPLGIPTLTAPFVFATWLFLLPKADLKPHPHQPIAAGLFPSKVGAHD